ncbi:MAG: AEC family transporter [Kiritimatiellae bacterium]|nr:AEC family transporter [Kiritimatiellia bacterium]
MQNLSTVAAQVGVLFALMAVGAACRRLRLVDAAGAKGVVNVLIYAVTPCLIVDVFQRPFDASMLRNLGAAFLISAAAHAALIALARLTARGGAGELGVLRLATVFSNAGFMGVPLEQAVLGDEGVFYGIVYVATFNLFIWSWGLGEMSGGAGRANSRESLRMVLNPGTIGLACALPLFLFSATLPGVLRTPVHLMAGMNTPLAMVAIGFYLAGADFRRVLRLPAAYAAAFIRLVGFPLALVGAFFLLRGVLDRTMALALVIGASAPVAAMVAMFASRFERDVDLAVALVSGTTLLSVATMPPLIALAMAVL